MTISRDVVLLPLFVTLLALAACDGVSRLDDTLGLQSYGRWEWHGRIVAEADPTLTIARLRIDTSQGGGDVVLARYDFNPAVGEGDEYSLTLGLELGRAHDLRPGRPYAFGAGPGQIAAHATVASNAQRKFRFDPIVHLPIDRMRFILVRESVHLGLID